MARSFHNFLSAVWPRHGIRRTTRFLLKKLVRIAASPHSIAAGIAAGVLVSFTPFIGLHFFMSFVVAYVVGGNMIAAAIGTAVGNPLTFPFIWSISYSIGSFLLGAKHTAIEIKLTPDALWYSFHHLWPVLKTTIIGGLPLGIFFGLVSYGVTYYIVRRYKRRKQIKKQRALAADQTSVQVAS